MSASRRRLSAWTVRTGLVVASTAVMVAVLELLVRWAAPQDVIKPMVTQLDPEIIYTLKPNYEAHLKGTAVRLFHLRTNSLGLREREIPFQKPAGTFRILLLGDSVSMAEGVELEETYLKQFESLAKARGWRSVETINAAVRGYGNDQELILFRRIGKRFHPDLVILALYTGNDLDDNLEGQLFRLEGHALVQQPATPQSSRKYRFYSIQSRIQDLPGYSFIMAHSHLANLVRAVCAKILQDTITRDFEHTEDVAVEAWPEFQLTDALIRAWAQEVRESGARPWLLVIPTREEVQALKDGPRQHSVRIDRAVEAVGRAEEILTINLTSEMVRHPHGGDIFWLEDGHLSPEGHRWVAEALFATLRSDQLLPKPTAR